MNRNAIAAQVTSAKCDLRNEQQVEKREESRGMKDGSGDIGLLFYFFFMSFVCGVVSKNLHRGIREESSSDREQGEQIPHTTALRS